VKSIALFSFFLEVIEAGIGTWAPQTHLGPVAVASAGQSLSHST